MNLGAALMRRLFAPDVFTFLSAVDIAGDMERPDHLSSFSPGSFFVAPEFS
jgi:hypothetical protein